MASYQGEAHLFGTSTLIRLLKQQSANGVVCLASRVILWYSFCSGWDILDIHPSITLSILLLEHSCCTYMEELCHICVSMCDQHFFVNNFNWLIYP